MRQFKNKPNHLVNYFFIAFQKSKADTFLSIEKTQKVKMMLDKKFIAKCECRLKKELINSEQKVKDLKNEYHQVLLGAGGSDFADLSTQTQIVDRIQIEKNKLFKKIKMINDALHRIEKGTYGICAYTEEPIEKKRLEIIPWTTLSIEGSRALAK